MNTLTVPPDYSKYKVVEYIPTLKLFEKKGFITFHRQTGAKITGLCSNKKFTCFYVSDGESLFEYNKQWFGLKYFSGCFMPYVVRYEFSNKR